MDNRFNSQPNGWNWCRCDAYLLCITASKKSPYNESLFDFFFDSFLCAVDDVVVVSLVTYRRNGHIGKFNSTLSTQFTCWVEWKLSVYCAFTTLLFTFLLIYYFIGRAEEMDFFVWVVFEISSNAGISASLNKAIKNIRHRLLYASSKNKKGKKMARYMHTKFKWNLSLELDYWIFCWIVRFMWSVCFSFIIPCKWMVEIERAFFVFASDVRNTNNYIHLDKLTCLEIHRYCWLLKKRSTSEKKWQWNKDRKKVRLKKRKKRLQKR